MPLCSSCGQRCTVYTRYHEERHGFKYGPSEVWQEELSECCCQDVAEEFTRSMKSSIHIATKDYADIKSGEAYVCKKYSNYREDGPFWVDFIRTKTEITADELMIARAVRNEINRQLKSIKSPVKISRVYYEDWRSGPYLGSYTVDGDSHASALYMIWNNSGITINDAFGNNKVSFSYANPDVFVNIANYIHETVVEDVANEKVSQSRKSG